MAKKDKAGCAGTCCEVSSTAIMSKLPELIYSVAGDGLYINLFAASEITSNVYGNEIKLTTVTNFPDDGNVTLKVSAKSKTNFNLRIRIPSWTEVI